MKQRIPLILTRGKYDLSSGMPKSIDPYKLTPKKKWDKIFTSNEITIFIHGFRNTRKGSIMGTRALTRKLRSLGYKHPVVGFSYDMNVKGAGSKNYSQMAHALHVGFNIARDNGFGNLYKFLTTLHSVNSKCVVNLVGHSMGCVVIESLVTRLMVTPDCVPFIKSVHLIGSPIPIASVVLMSGMKFIGKTINYYNPHDEVIKEGDDNGLPFPSCLYKINRAKVIEKRAFAKDHRFKSYVKTMRSFP